MLLASYIRYSTAIFFNNGRGIDSTQIVARGAQVFQVGHLVYNWNNGMFHEILEKMGVVLIFELPVLQSF